MIISKILGFKISSFVVDLMLNHSDNLLFFDAERF